MGIKGLLGAMVGMMKDDDSAAGHHGRHQYRWGVLMPRGNNNLEAKPIWNMINEDDTAYGVYSGSRYDREEDDKDVGGITMDGVSSPVPPKHQHSSHALSSSSSSGIGNSNRVSNNN